MERIPTNLAEAGEVSRAILERCRSRMVGDVPVSVSLGVAEKHSQEEKLLDILRKKLKILIGIYGRPPGRLHPFHLGAAPPGDVAHPFPENPVHAHEDPVAPLQEVHKGRFHTGASRS